MNENINKKQLIEFGILLGIGFPFFIGWLIPLFHGNNFKIWSLFIGLPFLMISFIKPGLLRIFYKNWIKLGNILGFLNSHVILGFIFFFVLLPISIFMKMLGHDPLNKRLSAIRTYKVKNKNYKINLNKIF
jgi:hypothetical protein